MSMDAYDTVDEFLDHMMDLTQAEREEALGILERLFCHCGHLHSVRYISRVMISHSSCDHVPRETRLSLSTVDKPSEHEVYTARLRNQAMVMRTRYSG